MMIVNQSSIESRNVLVKATDKLKRLSSDVCG